jgi:thioredoxin reductase (NADPH)
MGQPHYSNLPEPIEQAQVEENHELCRDREVVIVGGGLAGLSAAIYLGRALRDVLLIDAGESLALWEPEIQNYLGFPDCIDGRELLARGRSQAQKYGAEFVTEEIEKAALEGGIFRLQGKKCSFTAKRVLLATGVYHLPPKIPGVDECVGKSMFFCKDCDGYRVQDKRVLIIGSNNEAVDYALGLLIYTHSVTLIANGEKPHWDAKHKAWLQQYKLPVFLEKIEDVSHANGQIERVRLESGQTIAADCLFTTRGDVYHNSLAHQLGAKIDSKGEVLVDDHRRASVPGLYAAGCVTPANCQMIIAAGDGATAAQAINRDLFDKSLADGSLLNHRKRQIHAEETEPHIVS